MAGNDNKYIIGQDEKCYQWMINMFYSLEMRGIQSHLKNDGIANNDDIWVGARDENSDDVVHWIGECFIFVFTDIYVIITKAFGLPKPSSFCNVQRDVASLPSYSKLNSKRNRWNSNMLLHLFLIGSC